MLTVNNIDVFYGDLQVLWDVSFEVREAEILVLIGANGAGKSTTIKTLSSLLTPAMTAFASIIRNRMKLFSLALSMFRKGGDFLPR